MNAAKLNIWLVLSTWDISKGKKQSMSCKCRDICNKPPFVDIKPRDVAASVFFLSDLNSFHFIGGMSSLHCSVCLITMSV